MNKTLGWGVLGGVAVAAAACTTMAVTSGSPGSGRTQAVKQVMCFARATSSGGYDTLTFQVLGTPDCSNIAQAFSQLVTMGDYQFTPNTGSATGTEICSGVVGSYVVNVYNPKGGTGTLCLTAGLPAVP